MKANLYLAIVTLIMSFGIASAQTTLKQIKEEVMDVELLKNWKQGETKVIQDQTLTKLRDNGDGSTRTNVMYSPPSHNLFMHPTLMVMPIEVSKAGIVYIMVDRESKEAVNAQNFTVKIFDKTGMVELLAVTPPNSPGKEFKYGIWYNHFGIEVPAYAGSQFNIEVIDRSTGNTVTYFVQTNVEKNTFEMEKRLADR